MSVPWGILALPSLRLPRTCAYRIFILLFTFLCYASYHLSRKPISVVKNVLHHNCSIHPNGHFIPRFPNDTSCDWRPFDQRDYHELLGSLDYAFLFAYAIGMFTSGHVAERMDLRYFLSAGMMLSGFWTAAFGMGYFWNIHTIVYYVVIQILCGFFQSTGWPSVVTCMGNWYGKGNRGLIMGIWNSHTSVGNILGSVIAGLWVTTAWGWSFIVPGVIVASFGVLVFLFLVPRPEDVGCKPPDHNIKTVVSQEIIVSDTKETVIDVEHSVQGTETQLLLPNRNKPGGKQAITICAALKIPGVVEFALCLFFAKLVSYTFLFWLPYYIGNKAHYNAEKSADLSTLFDAGGILGGIIAGVISDRTQAYASTCMVMLLLAAPVLYVYDLYGSQSFTTNVVLLLLCGTLVNGPYALITTAVSADLGTHKTLQGNAKALATVTAIIDGTGSMGAALGPLLTGLISPSGWNNVFFMLIASDMCALMMQTLWDILFRSTMVGLKSSELALIFISGYFYVNKANTFITRTTKQDNGEGD